MGNVALEIEYVHKEKPKIEGNSYGEMYRLMVSDTNLVAAKEKNPIKLFKPWENSQTLEEIPGPERDPKEDPRNPFPQDL